MQACTQLCAHVCVVRERVGEKRKKRHREKKA